MKNILTMNNRRCGLLPVWAIWAAMIPLKSSALDDFLAEEKAYYLCAGCHGPETASVLYRMPHDIPNIIGQKKDYLLKQLIAYREGQREHPNMSGVLVNYSDQNLADLAEYYQNLGPKRPERKPPAHSAIAPPANVAPVNNTPALAHKNKAKKSAIKDSLSLTNKKP